MFILYFHICPGAFAFLQRRIQPEPEQVHLVTLWLVISTDVIRGACLFSNLRHVYLKPHTITKFAISEQE